MKKKRFIIRGIIFLILGVMSFFSIPDTPGMFATVLFVLAGGIEIIFSIIYKSE